MFPKECCVCSGMFLQLSSDDLNVCKKKKISHIYGIESTNYLHFVNIPVIFDLDPLQKAFKESHA